jgi:hypothetical protein
MCNCIGYQPEGRVATTRIALTPCPSPILLGTAGGRGETFQIGPYSSDDPRTTFQARPSFSKTRIAR